MSRKNHTKILNIDSFNKKFYPKDNVLHENMAHSIPTFATIKVPNSDVVNKLRSINSVRYKMAA